MAVLGPSISTPKTQKVGTAQARERKERARAIRPLSPITHNKIWGGNKQEPGPACLLDTDQGANFGRVHFTFALVSVMCVACAPCLLWFTSSIQFQQQQRNAFFFCFFLSPTSSFDDPRVSPAHPLPQSLLLLAAPDTVVTSVASLDGMRQTLECPQLPRRTES